MQRVPSKNVSMRGVLGSYEKQASSFGNERSAESPNNMNSAGPTPMHLIAQRIRDEQGAEQLKAFLVAMRPFAAPNELKKVGRSFGIDMESVKENNSPARQNAAGQGEQRNDANMQYRSGQNTQAPQFPIMPQMTQMPQLQMLQTIMTLQNMMGRGRQDAYALMNTLGGLNGRS